MASITSARQRIASVLPLPKSLTSTVQQAAIIPDQEAQASRAPVQKSGLRAKLTLHDRLNKLTLRDRLNKLSIRSKKKEQVQEPANMMNAANQPPAPANNPRVASRVARVVIDLDSDEEGNWVQGVRNPNLNSGILGSRLPSISQLDGMGDEDRNLRDFSNLRHVHNTFANLPLPHGVAPALTWDSDVLGANANLPPDFRDAVDAQATMVLPSPSALLRLPYQGLDGPSLSAGVGDAPQNPYLVQEAMKDQTLAAVSAVFPGICLNHVSYLWETISQSSEEIIEHILAQVEKGESYPKGKDVENTLKRKRDVEDEEQQLIRKYKAMEPLDPRKDGYGHMKENNRVILSHEFPDIHMKFIDSTLRSSNYSLFVSFGILAAAERTSDPAVPRMKRIRKLDILYPEEYAEEHLRNHEGTPLAHSVFFGVLKELQIARKVRKREDTKYQEARAEEENTRQAIADGSMGECMCCYEDVPLNRMVHCNSEELHLFCYGCARRNAEEEIGKSKYALQCMATGNCGGGFDMDQRDQFLDEPTKIALERNEQESNLRLSGIENLASCPFCPYAAEYPPISEHREFHCMRPSCLKTSCRLCKTESHIPKSCAEAARDNGLSLRRQIEEAMSAALIRYCNACGSPGVKDEGCNKITCSRPGCGNIQCYICSKSCDYTHFDSQKHGGRAGQCPLFESVKDRHDNDVSRAEREALAKVLAENPQFSEEELRINRMEADEGMNGAEKKKEVDVVVARPRLPIINAAATAAPAPAALPAQRVQVVELMQRLQRLEALQRQMGRQ